MSKIGEKFHNDTKLDPSREESYVLRLGKPPPKYKVYPDKPKIKLPQPIFRGISVEEAILRRRSIREYSDEPLKLFEVSHILFSAQGITGEEDRFYLRAAPSAGALYPIEIYPIVHNVDGLEKGIYHYNVKEHSLELIKKGDFRRDIYVAGLYQESLLEAAMVIVYSAVFRRTTYKYGERGYRYVYIEAGHIAQNVALQCVSLGVSSCVIGAFFDDMVDKLLELDTKEEGSVYIQTIGRAKTFIKP